MTTDKAGNLYGTTYGGGVNGAGLAYELSNKSQGWVFDPLYSFLGGSNGQGPSSPILGAEGALYGNAGGGLQNCGLNYCGLVYSLRPAPTACLTGLCSWTENTLYQFLNGTSTGDITTFDQAGNLYGTSLLGGAYGNGAIFELTPSDGGWTEKILYSFNGYSDGEFPTSLLVGNDGNLYGTTAQWGNYNAGVVFQLVPSGDGWTENAIRVFEWQSGSMSPYGLVQDSLGNLYGVATAVDSVGIGTSFIVFKLSPSNGNWLFNVLYQSQTYALGLGTMGASDLAIDAAGNWYLAITDYCNGEPPAGCDGTDTSWGLVVTGSPDGSSSNLLWHTFGVDFTPNGPLATDASGNVYGTTGDCGKYGNGTVWKVTH